MGNDLMLPIAERREDQGIFQGETGAVSSSPNAHGAQSKKIPSSC